MPRNFPTGRRPLCKQPRIVHERLDRVPIGEIRDGQPATPPELAWKFPSLPCVLQHTNSHPVSGGLPLLPPFFFPVKGVESLLGMYAGNGNKLASSYETPLREYGTARYHGPLQHLRWSDSSALDFP
jgi:hypothetical protein